MTALEQALQPGPEAAAPRGAAAFLATLAQYEGCRVEDLDGDGAVEVPGDGGAAGRGQLGLVHPVAPPRQRER